MLYLHYVLYKYGSRVSEVGGDQYHLRAFKRGYGCHNLKLVQIYVNIDHMPVSIAFSVLTNNSVVCLYFTVWFK
jgi:hypothetical protein